MLPTREGLRSKVCAWRRYDKNRAKKDYKLSDLKTAKLPLWNGIVTRLPNIEGYGSSHCREPSIPACSAIIFSHSCFLSGRSLASSLGPPPSLLDCSFQSLSSRQNASVDPSSRRLVPAAPSLGRVTRSGHLWGTGERLLVGNWDHVAFSHAGVAGPYGEGVEVH